MSHYRTSVRGRTESPKPRNNYVTATSFKQPVYSRNQPTTYERVTANTSYLTNGKRTPSQTRIPVNLQTYESSSVLGAKTRNGQLSEHTNQMPMINATHQSQRRPSFRPLIQLDDDGRTTNGINTSSNSNMSSKNDDYGSYHQTNKNYRINDFANSKQQKSAHNISSSLSNNNNNSYYNNTNSDYVGNNSDSTTRNLETNLNALAINDNEFSTYVDLSAKLNQSRIKSNNTTAVNNSTTMGNKNYAGEYSLYNRLSSYPANQQQQQQHLNQKHIQYGVYPATAVNNGVYHTYKQVGANTYQLIPSPSSTSSSSSSSPPLHILNAYNNNNNTNTQFYSNSIAQNFTNSNQSNNIYNTTNNNNNSLENKGMVGLRNLGNTVSFYQYHYFIIEDKNN